MNRGDEKVKKEKVIKIGIIVFVVFILCTILSRGLYSFSVANVTLATPQKYTIDHTVMTSGRVEAMSEVPILVEEGLVVVEYYALEGEKIEKGDPLLRVDTELLQKELTGLEDEVSILSLQIQEAKETDKVIIQNNKIEKDYAQDNYDYLEKKYKKELEQQFKNWNDARKEYETYKTQGEIDENYSQELEGKIKEQEKIYQDILEAKEKDLAEAKKAIELANINTADSTSIEQLEIQVKSIKKQIANIEKLIEEKGKIFAEYSGTVTRINVGIGEITSNAAVMLLSDERKGFKVTVSLEKEAESYVDMDSKVIIKGISNGEKLNTEEASLLSINMDENQIQANVSLKDNRFCVGMNVEVEILSEKYTYENCIPIQAVHQESGNTYFVYVVDRKETVLGEEMIARPIPIKIKDKDYMFVAVEAGDISSNTDIVLSSDKIIDNGSTIRIKGLQ